MKGYNFPLLAICLQTLKRNPIKKSLRTLSKGEIHCTLVDYLTVILSRVILNWNQHYIYSLLFKTTQKFPYDFLYIIIFLKLRFSFSIVFIIYLAYKMHVNILRINLFMFITNTVYGWFLKRKKKGCGTSYKKGLHPSNK